MPQNQTDPEFESQVSGLENEPPTESSGKSEDVGGQVDTQPSPDVEIPPPGGEPYDPERIDVTPERPPSEEVDEPSGSPPTREVAATEQVKTETVNVPHQKRHSGSLFFPLLLIVSGVVLLMSNLGILSNSAWETMLSLWPLLFVAWGLDALWRNDGITGAVFLLGVGVVFLLGNLGYLRQNPWQVLLTLWPVLLVAIGYDIIVGKRRKLWTNLLGLFIVGVIMIGTLWMAGIRWPGSPAMMGEQISYGLQGASRAEVRIIPGVASLKIGPSSKDETLISGTIPVSSLNQRIQQEFSKEGDLARIILESTGMQVFIPTSQRNSSVWDVNITRSAPIDLQIEMAAGDSSLKLSGMDFSNLDYQMALGQVKIILPDKGNFPAKISGAIGQIIISVPEEIGLQVETGTALVARTLPPDYVKISDNLYRSPNYDSVEHRINLTVELAIGQVVIEEE